MASARAELGYLIGHVLVFGTVGIGFTEYELSVTDPDSASTPFQSADFDQQGVVYGGGVEIKVAEGVSIGALYLHYDVGKTFNIADDNISGFNDADDGDFLTFDDVDVVRARLNIQLTPR